jgi:glutathione S-transferase
VAPAAPTLYQIRISHNCLKVRTALKRKGLAWETVEIPPHARAIVRRVSGQGLVPVLSDGGVIVADSTNILLHLEARHPDPPLLPRDPAARAECLILEDWADQAFMDLTRRLAYWRTLRRPGSLERAWGLPARGPRTWILGRVGRLVVRRRFGLSEGRNRADEDEARRLAALAVERLGGGRFLVGAAISIADISLASMAAPLWAASPALAGHDAVRRLLDWAESILDPGEVALYRRAV